MFENSKWHFLFVQTTEWYLFMFSNGFDRKDPIFVIVTSTMLAFDALYPVLLVRFEVGVSLLLAPAGAYKRGPKAPFPLLENAGIQSAIRKIVPTELWREPGLTKSTDCAHSPLEFPIAILGEGFNVIMNHTLNCWYVLLL